MEPVPSVQASCFTETFRLHATHDKMVLASYLTKACEAIARRWLSTNKVVCEPAAVVTRVLGCQQVDGVQYYFLQWEDGSYSWEPKKNLSCPLLVADLMQAHGKETFHGETTDTKIDVNKLFIQTIKEQINVPPEHIKCVTLDTPALVTSNMLMDAGVRPCNIIVPNPFVPYKKMHCANRELFTLHCTVKEMLDLPASDLTEISKFFHGLWLDYCASLRGNKETMPLIDMMKVFQHGRLSRPGVFAITLSYRGGVSWTSANDIIQGLARDCGYTLELLHHKQYKSVFFLCYVAR